MTVRTAEGSLIMNRALRGLALGFVVGAALSPAPSQAQATCGEHSDACEAVCTPARVARYHFGSLRRCTASCEPRWQECLRSGIWVDLERLSTGRAELAPPY